MRAKDENRVREKEVERLGKRGKNGDQNRFCVCVCVFSLSPRACFICVVGSAHF